MADLKTFEFEDADGKAWEIQAADLDAAVAAFKQIAGTRAVKPYDASNRKAQSILPLATDEKGDIHFDPTAGPLQFLKNLAGMAKSGVTAPGDIMSGELTPDDPEYLQRVWDTSSLMTGVNPGVASGERLVPGALKNLKPAAPKVPTAQELKAAGSAGFTKAEEMGVDYSTTSLKSMVDEVVAAKKLREARAPDTFSILNEIKAGPDKSVVTLASLRDIRMALNDIAGEFSPSTKKSDRKAAQDAIRALDEFMGEPSPESVVAGIGVGDGGTALAPATAESFSEAIHRARQSAAEKHAARDRAAEAGATIKEANANYAAAERSNTITGKIEKAEISAAATGSGLNLDNRTRQVLSAIIDPERPRNRRGYSQEELALIRDIVDGKHGADAARWVGNYLGGGGGLGAVAPSSMGAAAGAGLGFLLGGAGGSAVGGGIGATVPPLLGRILKGVSNKITAKQAAKLDEKIRMRSPLYKQREASPPMTAPYPVMPDIISRALMLGGPEMVGNSINEMQANPSIQDILNRALLLQEMRQDGTEERP